MICKMVFRGSRDSFPCSIFIKNMEIEPD
jgi:hypothetical protein